MKKIIFTTLTCLLLAVYAGAQSFGVSAYALGFIAKYPDAMDRTNNTNRQMGHMSPFSPGIRIEGNYILQGYSIPVSAFNGIGFSYYFPHTDSAFYIADLANNSYNRVEIAGTAERTCYVISLRFGYEIPQEFNEFLLLHFGWGMGYKRSSSRFILPEKTATFNYNQDDFKAEDFLPEKSGRVAIEILFGGIYELEHFSVTAQYSAILGLGGAVNNHPQTKYMHGITAGIYLPLKRL
ncbi:MAG: hypothetical protein M3R17_07535 [Bacteroidota bacterium]|nr:hypothetical protein [Bacteroidota bacterium]